MRISFGFHFSWFVLIFENRDRSRESHCHPGVGGWVIQFGMVCQYLWGVFWPFYSFPVWQVCAKLLHTKFTQFIHINICSYGEYERQRRIRFRGTGNRLLASPEPDLGVMKPGPEGGEGMHGVHRSAFTHGAVTGFDLASDVQIPPSK